MNWHLLSLNTSLKWTNSPYETQSHHEDFVAFQKRFTTDVNCLENTVISNPFMLEGSLSWTTTIRQNLNICVFEGIKIIETEGETIPSFLGETIGLSWTII